MMLFYRDDWVEIWNSDAKDLSFIADNSVHLVITSPPYNVGINYNNHNDRMTQEDYLIMLEMALRETYRVLVSGGRIAINVPSCVRQTTDSKNAFVAVQVHNILERIGFLPREWIGWVKIPIIQNEEQYKQTYAHQPWGKSTAWGSWKSPSCPSLRDTMEYIIVMDKEKHNLEGDRDKIDITKEEFMKYTSNMWQIYPARKEITRHPASFPEALVYRLVKLYSYQGNTVLDLFAGSGQVGVVAKYLNRKAILVDIDKEYCALMKSRVAQETLF